MRKHNSLRVGGAVLATLLTGSLATLASEANIMIPNLKAIQFEGLGGFNGVHLLYGGLIICLIGAAFGLIQYLQTKALPVHKTMRDVSSIIWETCKTYLIQQGKFLAILWV